MTCSICSTSALGKDETGSVRTLVDLNEKVQVRTENPDDELVEYDEIEIEAGARYTGQWKGMIPIRRESQKGLVVLLGRRSHRSGQGVLRFPDDSNYKGDFVNGNRHGKGVFVTARGNVYEGDWEEDKMHGQGKYSLKDGSTYEGGWLDGRRSGQGVENWVDGSKYEGQFLLGNKHGDGIHTSSDGKTTTGVLGATSNGLGAMSEPA